MDTDRAQPLASGGLSLSDGRGLQGSSDSDHAGFAAEYSLLEPLAGVTTPVTAQLYSPHRAAPTATITTYSPTPAAATATAHTPSTPSRAAAQPSPPTTPTASANKSPQRRSSLLERASNIIPRRRRGLSHGSSGSGGSGGSDKPENSPENPTSADGRRGSTERVRLSPPKQPQQQTTDSLEPPPIADTARARARSLSGEMLLVDSRPLSSGPLFSGKPRPLDEGERLMVGRHSYTPQRARTIGPRGTDSPDILTVWSLASSNSSANLDGATIELPQILARARSAVVNFLQSVTCYDMMPTSVKIVVFDTQLGVKKAFFALVQNGIRSAPLWDSKRQQFVGMLTITDFINILRQYYVSPHVAIGELEEHRIQTWRDLSRGKRPEQLVSVDPMAVLYDALHVLIEEKIHRLPVIDSATGNATSILTHKRILTFILANVKDAGLKPLLDVPLRILQLGTYDNIFTVKNETPLITVLNLLGEKRVSAVPVVDDEGHVVNIYAKHDVINLAREGTYNNLDVTVQEALTHRSEDFEGVQTCTLHNTFGEAIDQMVRANVHRLVVVTKDRQLEGILSLSDILRFLIQES